MRDIIENGIKLVDFMDTSDWPGEEGMMRQKRFYLGDEGDPDVPLVLVTHLPPNSLLPRHYHQGTFVDVVVQGTSVIDGEECPAGTLRWFPAKATYGPVHAGPEGCIFVEFYLNHEGLRTTVDWDNMSDEIRESLASRGINRPD